MNLSKPKPTLVGVVNTIDDKKTGQTAREYRFARRIKLREIAPLLKTPCGTPMQIPNLSLYEGGCRQWSEQLFSDYIKAVDKVAKSEGV